MQFICISVDQRFFVIVSCKVEAGALLYAGDGGKKNKPNLKCHNLLQSIKNLHGIA